MIDVTVKTLDSQNHPFSVPDDITVKDFKVYIAASVNIGAEQQRLIYCGRVLQDDKRLNDYDVNGKVIHLVQRAPPQSLNPHSDGGTSQSHQNSHRHVHHHHHHIPRGGASQVFVSAFPVPSEGSEGHGPAIPAIGPSSSLVRLTQARSMIQQANQCLQRLENSGGPDEEESFFDASEAVDDTVPTTSSSTTWLTGPSSTTSTTPVTSSSSGQPQQPSPTPRFSQPIAQAAQAATAAALAAAMGAVRSTPNMSALQSHFVPLQGRMTFRFSNHMAMPLHQQSPATSTPGSGNSAAGSQTPYATQPSAANTQSQAASGAGRQHQTGASGASQAQSATPSSQDSSGANSNNSQAQSNTGNMSEGTADGAGAANGRALRIEHPRTVSMAEVLTELQQLQIRLQPHLERYQQLMVDDPTFNNDNAQVTEAQRTVSLVSETFHLLSHAYHAVSDIMVDFRRPPPRELRALPFVIQQPTILQAGVPLQAQINVTTTVNDDEPAGAAAPDTANSATADNELPRENAAPLDSSFTTSTPLNNSDSSSSDTSGHPHFNFSMTHGEPVVFMEVGPNGSISLDPSQTGQDPSMNANINWTGNPPPEFIQNIVQAIQNQMNGRPRSTVTTAAANPANNNTQNSQARGNTETSTTTSTQTRSTSRPHVQMTPIPIPGVGLHQFDPFLPCNSHHVSVHRRPQHQNQNQQQASNPIVEIMSTMLNQVGQHLQGMEADDDHESRVTSDRTSINTNQNQSSNVHLAMNPSLVQLMGQLSQQRNQASTAQAEEPHRQGQRGGGVLTDQMFTQLVQGVTSQVTGAFTGQQASTVADFLMSLPDYTYTEGDDVVTDLLMTVARHITFREIMSFFFGRPQSLDQVCGPVREFVRTRILLGEEPTPGTLHSAVDRIMENWEDHIQAAQNDANVREGIDYGETIHSYMRQRLLDVLQLVLRTDQDASFGASLAGLWQTALSEFTVLSASCFTDGMEGVERVVRSRIESLMEGINPLILQWTGTNSVNQLRARAASVRVTEAQVQHYIVSSQEGERMRNEREKKRKNREKKHTVEPMETGTGATDSPEASHEPRHKSARRSADEEAVGGVAMETDAAGSGTSLPEPSAVAGWQDTVTAEAWHNVIPETWVPVISRDIRRQYRQAPQPPFSDAYLSSVPVKRRRTVNANKPQGSIQNAISGTLRRAINEAQVMPSTSVEEVVREVAHSEPVRRAYRDQVRRDVARRLDKEEDVRGPDSRFKRAREYFDK